MSEEEDLDFALPQKYWLKNNIQFKKPLWQFPESVRKLKYPSQAQSQEQPYKHE
jgi:hypothetical protein